MFQTLPGSNFTVNGATPPSNSALTTAAAELHINANWTATAKFDGEFGAGSQTYAGTGTLKYSRCPIGLSNAPVPVPDRSSGPAPRPA